MKPTSKIIQIQIDPEYKVIIALCEDGSIWERQSAKRDPNNNSWFIILDPFHKSGIIDK